jgi:iron complex outermembrane receptor protein
MRYHGKSVRFSTIVSAIFVVSQLTHASAQTVEELQHLSIEDLTNIEITSVSKRPEPLSQAPAAIYVISHDDIRRSGAVNVPEALRLAPNLIVAQDSSQTYAISARGFNATTSSNKMLVLIDGRAIYAPVFSGVYWDQLQVPLDDIERIEVISGPGGTLYGANAVNGAINIITRNSSDTQGGLADLKAGPLAQLGLLRYGGTFGDQGSYRVYGQGFGMGPTLLPDGSSAKDNWSGEQTGFRADWGSGADTFMTEGDIYRNINSLNGQQSGGDIVGRWNHAFSATQALQAQMSYDHQIRVMPGYHDGYDSYDAQLQYTQSLGRHVFVAGGEYRLITDQLVNTANVFVLLPSKQTTGVGDFFAQDTYAILDNLKLTLGAKLEYSSYTGLDILPNVRLGWAVTDQAFLWAAVSRAVRTPSRLDRDLTAPVLLARSPNFESEKLIAYELGYRGRPTSKTSLSISLYYNVYQDLRITGFSATPGYLFQLLNAEEGETHGVEAWGDWSVLSWWRLSAGLNLEHKDLHVKPGFVDISAGQSEGFDPGYQAMLRSSMDLPHAIELDAGLRFVGDLTDAPIRHYTEANFRVGWHATDRIEISLAGSNMFAPRHAETVTPGNVIQYPQRSVYLGLRWKF